MNDTSSSPLDLAIVIVNYNTTALLRDCLLSVFASTGGLRLGVCVADNASPDDSVAMTRAEFPQVHVIANPQNVGYPRANNQGLRYFGFVDVPDAAEVKREPGVSAPDENHVAGTDLPRFALLLNPDTVLPPGALAEMLAFMAGHPRAGAAGPKLVRLDGSLDKACRRSFPTPATSLYHLLKLDRLFPHSPRFARYDSVLPGPGFGDPRGRDRGRVHVGASRGDRRGRAAGRDLFHVRRGPGLGQAHH